MIPLVLLMAIGSARPAFSGQARDWEEEGRKIAAELRCVVCQNLSVADSPSEMAQQMRAIILDQLRQGKTSEEIKAYFVSKYGEWVLLSPPARGFSLLVWLLPFAALGIGLLVAAYFIHRWVRNKRPSAGFDTQPDVIRRLRQEASAEGPTHGESRDDRFRKALLTEQARLRSDIQEFEFDFQAGKLSGTDYHELRRDIER
ncbi:MAG TPA: cytochrome c-type biogenesis protein, partial [Candidatus Manganitrophaceae bacterium]